MTPPRSVAVAWGILVFAGLLEIVWSLALKEAEGLTRLWPSVIGIGLAMVSLGLLSYALKSLPIGTAYAAWVGIGTVGVAAIGMLALDESASRKRLFFLGLIVVGVVGLNLVES